MRINIILTALTIFFSTALSAQTLDELKAMKKEKQEAINALKGELNKINSQIEAIPMGWEYGGVGIIGLDFAGNESWFAADNPFSSSVGYGLSASAFANLDKDKYFWNNLLTFNLQQVNTKIQEGKDGAETEVEAITDALDLSSLFGYKVHPKFAISAEAKFSTLALNFLEPGKLVASAGATWLPIEKLVVIVHPLGYEKNWPGEFVSAAGAKIGATYARKILPNVSWSSNLSAFIPYTGGDAEFVNTLDETVPVTYEAGDLFNWTWINGFSTTLWNNLGVGLNVGLRQDQQIADMYQFGFDDQASDNPIQFYYNLGISYTL